MITGKLKKCSHNTATPSNSVVVTPVPITNDVQHSLPSGQTGSIQITIPTPIQHPGLIPTQSIVPTDQGNTVVVTTYKMDIGFKCEPQLVLGYDSDVLAGFGLNLARFWRFDASGLVSYGFYKKEVKSGILVSFSVDKNAKIGFMYQINYKLEKFAGIAVALPL
jgi:hypothetical protein